MHYLEELVLTRLRTNHALSRTLHVSAGALLLALYVRIDTFSGISWAATVALAASMLLSARNLLASDSFVSVDGQPLSSLNRETFRVLDRVNRLAVILLLSGLALILPVI